MVGICRHENDNHHVGLVKPRWPNTVSICGRDRRKRDSNRALGQYNRWKLRYVKWVCSCLLGSRRVFHRFRRCCSRRLQSSGDGNRNNWINRHSIDSLRPLRSQTDTWRLGYNRCICLIRVFWLRGANGKKCRRRTIDGWNLVKAHFWYYQAWDLGRAVCRIPRSSRVDNKRRNVSTAWRNSRADGKRRPSLICRA